jgi:hypothetical protein
VARSILADRSGDLKVFLGELSDSTAIVFGAPFTADFMDARVTLHTPVEGGIADGGRCMAAAPPFHHHHAGAERVRLHGLRRDDRGGGSGGARHPRAGRRDLLDMSGSMDGAERIGATRDGLEDFGRCLWRHQQRLAGAGGQRHPIT